PRRTGGHDRDRRQGGGWPRSASHRRRREPIARAVRQCRVLRLAATLRCSADGRGDRRCHRPSGRGGSAMSRRTVLLGAHTGRRAALAAARDLTARLLAAGVAVRVLDTEAAALRCDGADVYAGDADPASGAELVVALGGDGTLLRAAELARPAHAPLL